MGHASHLSRRHPSPARGDRTVAPVERPWPPPRPWPLRNGTWLSMVVVSAVAGAMLTVTASGAQTRSPFTPAVPLPPPAGDETGDDAADGITYGFEEPGGLRGWDADDGSLVADAASVHSGERSLGVVVDAKADGRQLDVTASLRELSHPPRFTLANATLTCYVQARGAADGWTLGTITAVDGDGRRDQGVRVVVTEDRWAALTMIVGAVDEPSADGRPVRKDEGFDGRDVVGFGVRLRAASGQLPQAFNIDDCTVRPAEPDPDGAPTRSDQVEDTPGVAAPVARAPSVLARAPAPPDEQRTNDGVRGGRGSTGGRPGGDGDGDRGDDRGTDHDDGGGDDGAPDDDVVRYGFEGTHPRRGWTALHATVHVDDAIAHRGDRSLAVVPDGGVTDRVAARARVLDLRPRPGFPLDGARLACHVRGVPSPETADVYVALVAEDGTGAVDAGSVVALTDDWSVVSLVVGAGTQDPAGSFDADQVVAFTVHVAAASGALPASVNVDDCEVVRSTVGTP